MQLPSGAITLTIMGGCLCHAMEQNEYVYIPIIIFFPNVYLGFILYKNKYKIIEFLNKLIEIYILHVNKFLEMIDSILITYYHKNKIMGPKLKKLFPQ
jgi:hypothetical protein